jgi:hypothetical protein
MTYTVCQSDLQTDRDRILDLWRDNLPQASPDRYCWLYEDGPSAGWLVKSDETTTVGAVGLMGRTMKVFDDLLRAGQPIDLNIDADHRTVGPALGLQRALISTVDRGEYDLLYAFPNAASEPVQRRAGFRVLGDLGRWAKPLAVGNTLSARIRNPLARRAAATIVGPMLKLTSPETFYRRPADIQVHVADHFDSRFDALWETAAGQFPIVGERTSKYLTWRFGRCPDARYRVLCVSNHQKELLAYLVYRQDRTIIHIGDLFFAHPRHIDTLLAELLRLARKQKAEAVIAVYLGSQTVCRRLKHFGFWQRPCQWKALLHVNEQSVSATGPLFDVENWHLTHADIDTDE